VRYTINKMNVNFFVQEDEVNLIVQAIMHLYFDAKNGIVELSQEDYEKIESIIQTLQTKPAKKRILFA
jgi:predicted AAA+ superfamily ATPase